MKTSTIEQKWLKNIRTINDGTDCCKQIDYALLRNNSELAFKIGFDSGVEIVPEGVASESVVT